MWPAGAIKNWFCSLRIAWSNWFRSSGMWLIYREARLTSEVAFFDDGRELHVQEIGGPLSASSAKSWDLSVIHIHGIWSAVACHYWVLWVRHFILAGFRLWLWLIHSSCASLSFAASWVGSSLPWRHLCDYPTTPSHILAVFGRHLWWDNRIATATFISSTATSLSSRLSYCSRYAWCSPSLTWQGGWASTPVPPVKLGCKGSLVGGLPCCL